MVFKINSILTELADTIKTLKQSNLYRNPVQNDFIKSNIIVKENKKFISFCSNDYLGLAHNKKVKKEAIKAIKKYGTSTTSSRYIVGNNSLYNKIENKVAKIYQCQDALIFSSGYQAAIGSIPALVGKKDLIIADKLIHSCLVDGSVLSGAKLIRYAHNDLSHLQKIIDNNREKYQKIVIISEEIFSMDGDRCDISSLQNIAKKNECLLFIDCAHSLYQQPFNKPQDNNIIYMGTFSKSLAGFGGFITSNNIIIDYLRNYAKSAIYTTALPPAILATNLTTLKLICKTNVAKKTISNSKYLCKLLNIKFCDSAIIIVKTIDVKKTISITDALKNSGFIVSTIRPPTSPTARIRITINANHRKKDITRFAKILLALLAQEHIKIPEYC